MSATLLHANVLVPYETGTLGEWSSDIIQKALLPNSENSEYQRILSGSLPKLLKDICFIPEKQHKETILDLDEEGEVISNAEVHRFIVDIGSQEYHQGNFVNRRPAMPGDTAVERPKTFTELLCHFYSEHFHPSEKDHIKHSIPSPSLIHLVVYNRFHLKSKSRKSKKNDSFMKSLQPHRFVWVPHLHVWCIWLPAFDPGTEVQNINRNLTKEKEDLISTFTEIHSLVGSWFVWFRN